MNIAKTHRAEYAAWLSAKTRCYNPRYHNFRHYGGRGITMDDEWRHNFRRFFADMGPRPFGASLDRIDNDGPYSSRNCRWATIIEQHRNRRDNRRVTFRHETLTLAEWATRYGLCKTTLHSRLACGWPVERALTAAPAR